MNSESAGVLSQLIDRLGISPCILAIMLLVGGFTYILLKMFKHQSEMEAMRIKQLSELLEKSAHLQELMALHQTKMEKERYKRTSIADTNAQAG